jgi:hypothetical protein
MVRSVGGFITLIAISAALHATVQTARGAGGSLHAQRDSKSAGPSVAGRWRMSVDAGAHGTTSMGLALEQDGKKVTGTFLSPHGEMPVQGEFVDGTLQLATTSKEEDDTPHITLNATLNDDGTLAGYLSSQRGDLTWTAERVKPR